MSDLIDFESPSADGNSVALTLPPLIPPPKSLKNSSTSSNANEVKQVTPPSILTDNTDRLRRSLSSENNPFDLMMRKVVDYERNRDDPFENVMAMSVNTDDACLAKRPRRNSSVKDDIDMSIITDLNNTNLIDDAKTMPKITLSSPPTELSILSTSAMNDSFSESNKEANLSARALSQIDPYLSPRKSPDMKPRRSLSVTDSLRTSLFGEDTTLHSAQSSMFEDPLNIAFRKFSLKSNASSNISLNSQSNSSSLNKKYERLSSDSSVFSGVSNISAIPNDSMSKGRLGSDGSVFSGISNLSIIPKNSTQSSCDSSSMFSNDTINKAFIASNSQLNSNDSSVADSKSCDQSDLIKKFYAIKTRMSTSLLEAPKNKDKCEKLTKSMMEKKEKPEQKSEEKLIDVTNGSDSVFTTPGGVNDIIVNEAKAIAQEIENVENWRLTTSKALSLSDDDLLLSKTQLNFDDLPPSDDEVVDNLIVLPVSPVGQTAPKEEKEVNVEPKLSPKANIKALESEFIDTQEAEKKAAAATLLLEIEKLVQDKSNPDTQKVMHDLQKLLGVECDSNTDILKVCLQSTNSSPKNTDHNTAQNSNKLSGFKDLSKYHNDTYELECPSEELICNSPKSQVKDLFKKSSPRCSRSKTVKSLNDSSEDQKLVGILENIKELISHKKSEGSKDFLRKLSTVLSNEVQKKNKISKQSAEYRESRRSISKLHRSTSALYKSFSNQSLNKSQGKTIDSSPLRRSLSISRSNLTPSRSSLIGLATATSVADKQMQLMNIRKRFPSDPGFLNPDENKENRSPNSIEYYKDSSQSRSRPAVEAVVARIRRKPTLELTKKGPLKAVMPLGNMQKKTSIGSARGSVTPPKTNAPHIVSSTPNAGSSKKSKPTASSTPNSSDALKSQRILTEKHYNGQRNTSPVSPSSLLHRKRSSKRSPQRLTKTLSPQKRSLTPKKYGENVENDGNSKLPRYSPRPVKIRNFSFSDLKTAKSPPKSNVMPKIPLEKKLQRHSFSSPLKNCNNIVCKGQPMSMISKLGKPRIQLGPEKENFA